MGVSAPGHRGFLWHTIGGSDTNMGHMAHVSRLPGSGNWGIHIGKEPYVGATLATTPDDMHDKRLAQLQKLALHKGGARHR